jgi:hypothetical protein
MKKVILIIIVFNFAISSFAQTGIGTTTPNASAKLDVYSTNKGFLPPRVTLTSETDASTIASPAEGLLVYNLGSVGLQAGYYYWNGANWATIATATSAGNGVTSSDLVKIYAKAYSTASGDIANASGYSFAVPVSGRYLFDFSCTAFSSNTEFTQYFKVRQGTTDLATDAQTVTNNGVRVEYNGKLEVNLQSGVTYNLYVTGGSRNSNDYDRVYMKLVSGNLPVTGQSVDYVSVSRTGSDQTVNTGNVVVFNTINGGNIPYNASTGVFSLTAGKTYKLIGNISLSNGNTTPKEVNIVWKNANGDILGTKGELLSPSAAVDAAGNGIAFAIYTPTANTTVSLYVNYSTTNAILWQTFTFASIEQIGSSAIINPWVLSGNDVYNTTGVVGIGTSSPSASAILDLTSLNKGFLPPRVALTAINNASPISSPATGLLIYNTASAGTYPNQITPGYYFWNGTIWTRIGNNNILASNAVTLGAVTTNPTLGTRYADRTYAIDFGSQKKIYVQLGFSGGNIGSGDYLFSLPSGVTFNTSADYNPTYTGTLWTPNIGSMSNYFIPIQGGIVQTGSWNFYGYVVPYSSTQYRILFPNNNVGGFSFFSSAWYTTNAQTTINFSFDIW